MKEIYENDVFTGYTARVVVKYKLVQRINLRAVRDGNNFIIWEEKFDAESLSATPLERMSSEGLKENLYKFAQNYFSCLKIID